LSHIDYHTKPSMPDCTTRDPQEDQNCAGLTTSLKKSANLVSPARKQRAKRALKMQDQKMHDLEVKDQISYIKVQDLNMKDQR